MAGSCWVILLWALVSKPGTKTLAKLDWVIGNAYVQSSH